MSAASDAEPLRYTATREEVLPFLPERFDRVLDIGCGAGGFGATLRRTRPTAELWGVEPAAPAAAAASSVYDKIVTDSFPGVDLDLPAQYFDVVLFLDVLEHMVDPASALRAAIPLLAENGRVLASIPNVRHHSVWWPLVRRGEWVYADTGLMDRTHLRWFTRSTMVTLFQDAGLSVEDVVGINRSTALGWKSRALAALGARVDEMLYVQYVVTATRAAATG